MAKNYDHTSDVFKSLSNFVKLKRKQNISWESILKLSFFNNDDSFERNFENLKCFIGNDEITKETYEDIIENIRYLTEEANTYTSTEAVIPSGNLEIPSDNFCIGSAWDAYQKNLTKKGFSDEAISEIKDSAYKILKNLSLNTAGCDPVKGMVVGNVQSGKTANMAALLALAADCNFNFFVVLTGTIENLRNQTSTRLIKDLGGAYNITWIPLNHLSIRSDAGSRLSDLHLSDYSKERYITTCLKNSTRLAQLIDWLNADENNKRKIKMLVIDDEADQAGINSNRMSIDGEDERERTAVNKMILALINNKNKSYKNTNAQARAINYAMYTATPYANFLNEGPGETLYPSNFVACLKPGDTYIGPQHIFGLEGSDIVRLNFVNRVEKDDVKLLTELYKQNTNELPQSFKDAVLWFYCTFAIKKFRKINEPVSMLIHTSARQQHHKIVADTLTTWINNFTIDRFLKECERVYKEQKSKISSDDFLTSYANYGKISNLYNYDYPEFDEIKSIISDIFNFGLSHIKIDEDGSPTYSKGVHICIDNCSFSTRNNENEHIRLLYPQDENLDYATGFIVIGGATLSRGLTLEGLTTSYFLRTVKCADTLMQMGRWFGYRQKYELLTRIWMTENTEEQFEFLSLMDDDLRKRIKYMEIENIAPALVGVKIMNHPKVSFLKLTANNRQQGAIYSNISFSGVATQTTMFLEDNDVINNNFNKTSEFINSLDQYKTNINNKYLKNGHLWTKVPNDTVLKYLDTMKMADNDSCFPKIKFFKKWFKDIAEKNNIKDFNIVVAGMDNLENSTSIQMGKYLVTTVNRSRKKPTDDLDTLIRIGALRSMKDFYADIDLDTANLSQEDAGYFDSKNSHQFRKVRKDAGLNQTSLLVIYVINKDSQPRVNEKSRIPMGTCNHIIGLGLVIPEAKTKEGDHDYIQVNINTLGKNPLDGVDIE